jgi:hypothetical protein
LDLNQIEMNSNAMYKLVDSLKIHLIDLTGVFQIDSKKIQSDIAYQRACSICSSNNESQSEVVDSTDGDREILEIIEQDLSAAHDQIEKQSLEIAKLTNAVYVMEEQAKEKPDSKNSQMLLDAVSGNLTMENVLIVFSQFAHSNVVLHKSS